MPKKNLSRQEKALARARRQDTRAAKAKAKAKPAPRPAPPQPTQVKSDTSPYHPVFGSNPPAPDKSRGVSHVGEFRLEKLTSHKLRLLRQNPDTPVSQFQQAEKILRQRALNLGFDPVNFLLGDNSKW